MWAKLKFPLLIFLAWYLIIFLFQVFLEPRFMFSPESEALKQRLFTGWVYNWDSGHYLSVVQNGYVFPKQNFFPLWPVFKYLKKTYFIYSLIVLLMPLATGMSVSMVRYVLVAFPVFSYCLCLSDQKY